MSQCLIGDQLYCTQVYFFYTLNKGASPPKNAALIWTLSKTGLTPPPDFWIFWYTFPKVKTFGTFGTLLCILIHPIFWQKVSQNFWIWSTPPPFLPKIPKILVHKKCPKTFGLLRNPPPMDEVQIKAAFFCWDAPLKVCQNLQPAWQPTVQAQLPPSLQMELQEYWISWRGCEQSRTERTLPPTSQQIPRPCNLQPRRPRR